MTITRKPILTAGERDGAFEVTSIDEKTATVKGRNGPDPVELRLDLAPGEELADRTIHFRSADLRQVLDVYQELSRRTVISKVLVGERFTLKSGANLSTREAISFLDRALAEKGIGVTLRGKKFVFVARTDQLDGLSAIPEPPAPAAEPIPAAELASDETFPPGMMKFEDTDLLQVLDIYQDLSERTVLRPQSVRSGGMTVRTQTPLTRQEAVWLMDAWLFCQGGLLMIPESEKFVFAVPSERKGRLPKFNPRTAATRARNSLPARKLRFEDADIREMVQLYAELSGREALPLESNFPHIKFSIRTQQELSPAEAMFALEAVAALNRARLELVGDDKVQIVRSLSDF